MDQEDFKDSLYAGAVVGNKSTGLLDYITEDRVDTIAIPFHDYGASRKVFDLSSPIYNVSFKKCGIFFLDYCLVFL